MDHIRDWNRLVRDLDGWSSASKTAPWRIRVTVPQASGKNRRVVIVMTPAEWNEMFTVAHGSFDSAFYRVKQTLLSLKPHEGFAVYADYGLEPSTTESLAEPVLPEPGSGTWVAWDSKGDVAGRLGEMPKRPSRRSGR